MSKRKAKPDWWRRAVRIVLWVSVVCFLVSLLLVLPLRWINPATSAIAIDRRLSAWWNEQPYHATRCWRSLQQLGPNAALAVIASEDQRFSEHWGIDFRELNNALQDGKRRRRGASTISQQLAKNLFLWHGRSYLRKGLEAYFAVLMEASLSKARILELYLNVVEFGPGTYGVCAGAKRSFQVEAARMSPYQAGLLAATLPNPHERLAHQPTPALHKRASWIIRQMQQLGGASYLAGLH